METIRSFAVVYPGGRGFAAHGFAAQVRQPSVGHPADEAPGPILHLHQFRGLQVDVETIADVLTQTGSCRHVCSYDGLYEGRPDCPGGESGLALSYLVPSVK